MRRLLKIEESKPHILDQGKETEATEWTLPDGRPHRDFGPAVEYKNGEFKSWHQNGKLHKEDGPTIIQISYNGSLIERYYVRGTPASIKDFLVYKEIGWEKWQQYIQEKQEKRSQRYLARILKLKKK